MRGAGCGQAIDSALVCRYLQDNAACYPPCACRRPSVRQALSDLNNGVVPAVSEHSAPPPPHNLPAGGAVLPLALPHALPRAAVGRLDLSGVSPLDSKAARQGCTVTCGVGYAAALSAAEVSRAARAPLEDIFKGVTAANIILSGQASLNQAGWVSGLLSRPPSPRPSSTCAACGREGERE